jgi:hypothetical protein
MPGEAASIVFGGLVGRQRSLRRKPPLWRRPVPMILTGGVET